MLSPLFVVFNGYALCRNTLSGKLRMLTVLRKFFTPTSKEGKLMISINGKDSVSQIGWGK